MNSNIVNEVITKSFSYYNRVGATSLRDIKLKYTFDKEVFKDRAFYIQSTLNAYKDRILLPIILFPYYYRYELEYPVNTFETLSRIRKSKAGKDETKDFEENHCKEDVLSLDNMHLRIPIRGLRRHLMNNYNVDETGMNLFKRIVRLGRTEAYQIITTNDNHVITFTKNIIIIDDIPVYMTALSVFKTDIKPVILLSPVVFDMDDALSKFLRKHIPQARCCIYNTLPGYCHFNPVPTVKIMYLNNFIYTPKMNSICKSKSYNSKEVNDNIHTFLKVNVDNILIQGINRYSFTKLNETRVNEPYLNNICNG